MKLFIFSILFFTFNLHADALFDAIRKSNPALVKEEIQKKITTDMRFTEQEKQMYLDFAQEIITRRRNALSFPKYPNGQALATDSIEPQSLLSFIAAAVGIIGTIGTIPISIIFSVTYHDAVSKLTEHEKLLSGIITGIIEASSIYLLYSSLQKIDANDAIRIKQREKLFSNAVKIKHMFL